jgi:hypothetical protein
VRQDRPAVASVNFILPPVPPGATRGLRAAADVAGIAWVA